MKKIALLSAIILLSRILEAQNPDPSLIGYWQNYNDVNSPYIQLDQVDARYNYIDVAFAVPHAGTTSQMEFIPDQVSQATLKSQIQTLQSQGRKVLISVGGASAPVSMSTISKRNTFITTMGSILNTYGFDGMDIDFEGSSLSVSGGTISAPADNSIINLIYAVKQIMQNYNNNHHKRLILSMAPETAFVQGGMSSYGGIWGAYLPVIDALRDSLEYLHVQLYNSGSIYGIDGNIYDQGTADFIVAACEAVIQGFNTDGGFFAGLPASKVAVGLPACANAAGGGFTDTATVKAAIDYLRGTGSKPGSYTLTNIAGYPSLRGMMTWSVNWDAVATCGSVYQYADNYEKIFSNSCSPCPIPVNLTSANITKTTANVHWTIENCALSYSIQYRVKGTTAWTSTNTSGNVGVKQLTGLSAHTIYQWKVKSKCSSGPNVFSHFSVIKSFTTLVARLPDGLADVHDLELFPNPAGNEIELKVSEFSGNTLVTIYNSLGSAVKRIPFEAGNLEELTVRVSDIPAGIYYIVIGAGENYAATRFVKE